MKNVSGLGAIVFSLFSFLCGYPKLEAKGSTGQPVYKVYKIDSVKNYYLISKVPYIFIIVAIFCGSCNKVFLADRANVLREQDGYIFEQKNQLIFVPMDINQDFFGQINGKKGYRIYQAPGYGEPRYAQGDSANITLHFIDSKNSHDALFTEKVHLVRVKLIYTDDKKSLSKEKSEIRFDYSGQTYSFIAYANRYLQIYQVVGVNSQLDRK